MKSLSKKCLIKLVGVHPKLVYILKEAIKTSPYNFYINSGLRSEVEQKKLYKKGRNTEGEIVTYCDGDNNKSNHQAKSDGYSYAVDFSIEDDFTINEDIRNLKHIIVARHIQITGLKYGVKLSWGGDWKKFKDYPHIEMKYDKFSHKDSKYR